MLTFSAVLALSSCSGDEPDVPADVEATRSVQAADTARQGSPVLTVDDEWAAIRYVDFDGESQGDTLTLTVPGNADGAATGSVDDAV